MIHKLGNTDKARVWEAMENELVHRASVRSFDFPQQLRECLNICLATHSTALRGYDSSSREVGRSAVLTVSIYQIAEIERLGFRSINGRDICELEGPLDILPKLDLTCLPYPWASYTTAVLRTASPSILQPTCSQFPHRSGTAWPTTNY
jgi:hypothetical protein